MDESLQGFYTANLLIHQKNRSAETKRELKENALKNRKERFDPDNNKTMSEKIAERKKQLEKEVDDAVSLVVPVPASNRLVLFVLFTIRSQISG